MANDVGLEFAGITDPGKMRAQNEDAIAISAFHGFAVLADGMGGYNAGEVASNIAASAVKETLEHVLEATFDGAGEAHISQQLVEAAQKANQAILDAARAEPNYHGMGTTLVAAVFHNHKVTIAHVGDSRAYRFRKGELVRLTRDHSLLQEQIDLGLIDAAMARFAHNKNLVTRAVGVSTEMEVEVHDHSLQGGDLYILCSDGLSDMVEDEEIVQVLGEDLDSLESTCRRLVQRANDNGGFDNISVILVRTTPPISGGAGLLERILGWVS